MIDFEYDTSELLLSIDKNIEIIARSLQKLVKMLDEGDCVITCSIEGKADGFCSSDLIVEVKGLG